MVALVAVVTPIKPTLLSVQVTFAEPFHQVDALLLQLSLPSCGPAGELPASQAKAPPEARVLTQLDALAAEVLIRLVATTE
jgi:hypothetical protein